MPAPCAKSSRKQNAEALADADSAAVAEPKKRVRICWRGTKRWKKQAALIEEAVVVAEPVGMATGSSYWIQKCVRVISDKAGPTMLNRSGIVTAVVPLPDGTLDLRLQSLSSDEKSACFTLAVRTSLCTLRIR